MIVDLEEPVVLIEGEPDRYHLPAPNPNVGSRRGVALSELLKSGGGPSTKGWSTVCGNRGEVFVLTELLAKRGPCPACVRLSRNGDT